MPSALLLWFATSAAAAPLDEGLRVFVPEPGERSALAAACEGQAREASAHLGLRGPEAEQLQERVLHEVIARLEGLPVDGGGQRLPMTADRIQRQVCAFEAFKAEVFVGSGVFPKRWFGYLDGQWDTRADELVLREVVDRAVPVANAELERLGHDFRLTDQEVISTWLAEGGTLILGDPRAAAGTLDPIMDVGLDSLIRGFGTWAPLVAKLDEAVGSAVSDTVVGDRYRLDFTLTDSIVGTVVMLCDERALLSRKLADAGRAPQAGRPFADQFILASLHYNSGLLFGEERVAMIREHRTAAYLVEISEKNADRRPLLPVLIPADAGLLLQQGAPYSAQWTSWNAVYHVLQRYTSWEALGRYTDWFTAEGELAAWVAPQETYVALTAASVGTPAAPESPGSPGSPAADSAPAPQGSAQPLWMGLGALLCGGIAVTASRRARQP